MTTRKLLVIAVAAVATGAIVGVVIAGSDEDSGSQSSAPAPELTVPGETTSTTRTREEDTTTTGTEPSGEGTTPAPDTGGATEPAPDTGGSGTPGADSEGNDVPPPAGSPAERFERFCQRNPEACGR